MAKPLYFFILFFITTLILQLQWLTIDAQKNGRIEVGQSLSAKTNGPSCISPSGDFAFGFHQFNNRSDLFLLAIWYENIPDTIVWYANEGNPVSQGSTIALTADKGLVLSNPQGVLLWNTLNLNGTVNYGFMDDTGNFALKSSQNEVVWESFKHPTDTLLPTQILDIGFEVDSRLTETNYTKGRFQLRLIPDGNLVLNTRELTSGFAYGAYYTTGTNSPANSPGHQLVYNESGYMYILRNDSTKYDLLPPGKTFPANDYYQRATLDFDGVLTWYSIPKKNTGRGWYTNQLLPNNICSTVGSPQPDIGSVPCGNNNICRLGSDGRPICECPQNYSLMEPDDTFGSCKPDFTPDECQGYGQGVGKKGEYTLVELQFVNWPFGDYARLNPCGEDECKQSCLDDCFCAAAIYSDGNGGSCWKKKLPLSNGNQDVGNGPTAWLKVSNYSINPFDPFVSSPPKEKNKINTLLSWLLGASAFANSCLLSAICLGILFIYRKKRFRWLDGGQGKSLGEYENVTSFTYQQLSTATDGFKEEIGRGAFGIVYKGMIGVGGHQSLVAVKKLDRISTDADKEFRNEVTIIGQTHHKNLVRLIGFCKEEDQRLLVYEYMSNGSLADYLFGDLKPSWLARIQIAHGIARGLLYLHEECSTQIIHCDIKPQNILLDDCYNARISDFGLAKLLVLNQTQTNTAIRGTKGYVAPEWFKNKPVKVKVDVYSFGVLLLEIICCRRCVCLEMMEEEEKAILTDWAFDCYQNGRLDSLVNDDMEALNDRQQLERFVMVALWCVQEDPSLRPSMRKVTQMLEGVAEVLDPPCPTSFSITTQN